LKRGPRRRDGFVKPRACRALWTHQASARGNRCGAPEWHACALMSPWARWVRFLLVGALRPGFVLWRPARTDPPPALVIGRFTAGPRQRSRPNASSRRRPMPAPVACGRSRSRTVTCRMARCTTTSAKSSTSTSFPAGRRRPLGAAGSRSPRIAPYPPEWVGREPLFAWRQRCTRCRETDWAAVRYASFTGQGCAAVRVIPAAAEAHCG
jgi:hypothetical protein